MKQITAVTLWNDSNGKRMTVTYSIINEETHKIERDNIKESFVLTAETDVATFDAMINLASEYITVPSEAELAEAGRILLGEEG